MNKREKNRDPSSNKKFNEEAKELVVDWLGRTTSHGIPNIVRARNLFIRILWICFFLTSFTYCIYVIIKSIVEYKQYKTTISTSYISETPTNFPAVTVCNLNPFNEDFAFDHIIEKISQFPEYPCIQSKPVAEWNTCFNVDGPEDVFNVVVKRVKRTLANSNFTDGDKELYGFDLKNYMYINCQYNNEKCHADEFDKFWHNEYGYCYTYNHGKDRPIKQTSQAGSNYGLKLNLALQPIDSQFTYRTGIYVVVHNQSTKPISLFGGIQVKAGAETYVGISRTFISKQPSPYSNCLKDLKPFSEYSKRLFAYFAIFNMTTYDQQLCSDLCYQDKLIDECGCCSAVTDPIRGARFCESRLELKCEDEFDAKFSTADTNQICKRVCREKCQSNKYKLSTNLAYFPSSAYLLFLSRLNQTIEKLPENKSLHSSFAQECLLRIIVNYEDYAYTKIDENPAITFEQLLGNVGGQLGLFIGISLLSLIEILEITSEFIVLFYERKIKSKFSRSNTLTVQ